MLITSRCLFTRVVVAQRLQDWRQQVWYFVIATRALRTRTLFCPRSPESTNEWAPDHSCTVYQRSVLGNWIFSRNFVTDRRATENLQSLKKVSGSFSWSHLVKFSLPIGSIRSYSESRDRFEDHVRREVVCYGVRVTGASFCVYTALEAIQIVDTWFLTSDVPQRLYQKERE